MSISASARNGLAISFAPVLQHWHRLAPRQQRIFGAVTILFVVAILFAYVWLPAVRERDRLTARLPQLNAQLSLMKKQAEEIRQLTSTSLIAPAPAIIADAATLQAAFGDGARVNPDANRAFRIVIPRIAYAVWWDRLTDVQSRHQLQIVSITLQALPVGNREISVDMVIADQPRAGMTSASGAVK
jgi:type II secretory pathway component PulM